jgi:hypothetical protein
MKYIFKGNWAVFFIIVGIVMFLINFQIIKINYQILKYWPAVLIYLGVELILNYFFDKSST